MKKYLIVIEPTETGFSGYLPDLPGCVATGASQAETEKNMRESIEFHMEGMAIPEARSYSTYLEVAS